jgi:hypothetical protein
MSYAAASLETRLRTWGPPSGGPARSALLPKGYCCVTV